MFISKTHGPAVTEAFLQQGNRLTEPTKSIFCCNGRERSVGGIAMPMLELAGVQRLTTLTSSRKLKQHEPGVQAMT